MSEEKHQFHLSSVWAGDSEGDGALTTDWGQTWEFGRPPQTGGKPGRTNPEELLVSAVVSCYSITLAILAEKRRLPVTRIELSAEGEMVRQPNKQLEFTAIRLYPKITLTGGDAAQQKTAEDSAYKAEEYCLISKALRGHVEISVFPEIIAE